MRLALLGRLRRAATVSCLAMLLALLGAAAGSAAAQPMFDPSLPHGESGPLPTTVLSGAPTWPAHPQTLAPPAAPAGESSSGGFDWGSAAVGAGSAIVLSALTLAIAATFVRRRRRARAPSLAR